MKFFQCRKKREIVPVSKVRECCSQSGCCQLKKIRKRKWPKNIKREPGWLAAELNVG